ncbi:MAG: LacI family DNA-binding transcriptional regulator [Ignavibacteriales bacterium]|nr:LacI family DNA-binding transcriptional regulator [Ignavibacteriales bacterium]
MHSNIIDVAKKAGVSIATVSRVLNDSEKVKSETREKILAVIDELKYVPNPAARGLIMRRTEAIGLLLPDLHGEFFSEIIRGADEAVQAQSYHLIVSSSHNDSKEIEAALRFMRGRVDAIIVMSPQVDSEILLANLPKSVPVVLLNCRTSNPHFDTIMTDGYGGAREMTNYLLDLGHTRIAVLTGGENNIESQERLRGFRSALRERDITPNRSLEFAGNFTEVSGYETVREVLLLKDRPTAIFAFNDSMAIGAIKAIREEGLKIPSDISVCGFDDIPVAKFLSPSLTSVCVPIHDLGVMAVNRVFDRIKKRTKGASAHMFVSTTLSIRNSCKKINTMSNLEKEGNAA